MSCARHSLVLWFFVVVCAGPSASAGLVLDGGPAVSITAVPDISGPYFGGEELTVDFWLSSSFHEDVLLNLVQFDFSASDSALSFAPDFSFDFSSLEGKNTYLVDSALPVPRADYTIELPLPSLMLLLQTQGMLHIGSLDVTLPLSPGIYRLDGTNANEQDPWRGAQIEANSTLTFGASYEWSALDGQLVGGSYDFEVVPEPGTGMLLLLGSIVVLHRRRQCTNR